MRQDLSQGAREPPWGGGVDYLRLLQFETYSGIYAEVGDVAPLGGNPERAYHRLPRVFQADGVNRGQMDKINEAV